MGRSSDNQKRNPLIPIGFAILVVLVIPPFIYSLGPKGPIKKDYVVFSTGEHRAYFDDERRYQSLGYQGYCVLQIREQLLVLESAEARADGTYLAEKISSGKQEFPSCPSRSRLILHDHQITLRPNMWGGLQDALARVFPSF